MYIEVVGKDINEFSGKSVIMFGAGSCGDHCIEEFVTRGVNIIAFSDNNQSLHGEKFKGYPILAPDELKQYCDKDIIITSHYAKQIRPQLEALGFQNIYSVKTGVVSVKLDDDRFTNPMLNDFEANEFIYEGLSHDKPFCVGRLGSVELECLSNYLYLKKDKSEYASNVKDIIQTNAGFFPTDDRSIDLFCELYLHDLSQFDLLLSMWYSKYEDKIYNSICPKIPIGSYEKLGLPMQIVNPWTKSLKNKKVLVIHPFEESIKKNFQNKDRFFEKNTFLPDFELITMKAVQSIAGSQTEFASWFEALKDMEVKIANTQFDIALIGAGAYGLPLAAFVKNIGKKAVHIGGSLQLYFGIKGKAWNKFNLYNECWTSPLESEKPINYKKVEAGRYW